MGIAIYILQGKRHDSPRIVIRCLGWGWPQTLALGLKAGDQRLDLAGPSPTKPLLVEAPGKLGPAAMGRGGGGVQMHQQVQEIEYLREAGEVQVGQWADPVPAVSHDA